ncbi:AbiJ-NTD4 domain-containing protein [Microbacterium sp. NPDC008134]|uniref:AbiJ-NTD4 domain-containing protein n=1 Tax=Microbacterium sp. NPDC008134 TaxID=3364183 RepID=UPI0036ED6018
MVSFAQRMRLRPIRSLVQTDALDEETRTELWNVVLVTYRTMSQREMSYQPVGNLTSAMWAWEFKKPRDEEPGEQKVWSLVKTQVLTGEWFDALDIIEAYVGYLERFCTWHSENLVAQTVKAFNGVFESYMVGYRFIEQKIVPLDNDADAEAVTSAIEAAGDFSGARGHLQRAADLLADRKNPDYANSIKESVSAVEAVVRKVTKEGTLGAGLKKLKDAGVTIHSALEGAWSKMYGWTSDAQGIRHAAVEATEADQAIAKYMLVTCSAFVTYLIESGRKAELV